MEVCEWRIFFGVEHDEEQAGCLHVIYDCPEGKDMYGRGRKEGRKEEGGRRERERGGTKGNISECGTSLAETAGDE